MRGALGWIGEHRWAILLVAILGLLVVSPFSGVYDRNDNLISPLAAVVVAAIILSTARSRVMLGVMLLLVLVWLVVSLVTDGSGLFAGVAIGAPLLFLAVMGSVFLLLAFWLAQVRTINAETLCAAVCGYMILGLFWTGIYALMQTMDARAIVAADTNRMEHGDLLYFSYTTLTTTGMGDLLPHNGMVRMWTVIEAVAGTFYNAIIIARLVSLYGLKKEGE